jgi:4-alpha-glucanotransferase
MFWRVRGKGVHVWSLPQEFFQGEDVNIPLPDLPVADGII